MRKILPLFLPVVLFTWLLAPLDTRACHGALCGCVAGVCTGFGCSNDSTVNCSSAFTPPRPNPLDVPVTTISTIGDFVAAIDAAVAWMLVFGLAFGVLFIIWGGVQYITAHGDETKTKDAKKIIYGSIIGVVFLVLAIAIVRIIANFFGATVRLPL